MSGYRTIHRERILPEDAIWSVQMTRIDDTHWRVFVGSSDGYLRVYSVTEKTTTTQGELDASAVQIQCDNVLLGSTQQAPETTDDSGTTPITMLGCTQVSTVRNYEGEDDTAGDLIVASLDLGGTVRIWNFSKDWEEKTHQPSNIRCKSEFEVEHSTGTTLVLAPPRIKKSPMVLLAVGCLDGTVALVSTGIASPSAKKDPDEAGSVVSVYGSPGGSSLALTFSWNPIENETLAIGRQDGAVDIICPSRKNHRLLQHAGTPVRSVVFTPDAALLVTGSDGGQICIFDMNRPSPVLVHHVASAHKSWILNTQCLADSRRFLTLGSDETIHAWNVGQLSQALHSFRHDNALWSMHHLNNSSRMVSGSDDGWLFVYSIDT